MVPCLHIRQRAVEREEWLSVSATTFVDRGEAGRRGWGGLIEAIRGLAERFGCVPVDVEEKSRLIWSDHAAIRKDVHVLEHERVERAIEVDGLLEAVDLPGKFCIVPAPQNGPIGILEDDAFG